MNDPGRRFEVDNVLSSRLLFELKIHDPLGSITSMELPLSYNRRSGVQQSVSGLAIALAPNLRRDRVSYRGELRDPLAFREAISALHDIVINDLRYKPRDKTAYEEYRAVEESRLSAVRQATAKAKSSELKAALLEPMPDTLEGDFRKARDQYWKARQQYSDYLLKHDRELWRLMMPCDPVITVAKDCLFFECFSADESSYGCLTVDRDAFRNETDVALGTTNVDYSWGLYEHFQKLRSYRNTHFEIDPSGFDVATQGKAGHREEKIDLPDAWLRGFMQLQSAMVLPNRRVPLTREALYAILAFLKRNRAARAPRAIRFELEPGKPIAIVMEPWEKRIELPETIYGGTRSETIRVWGRDRLKVLARVLPLIESVEVHLLGTGLPSFWVVRMPKMRLVLALSGWTTNNWTGASALQQLAPPGNIDETVLVAIAGAFRDDPARTFEQLRDAVSIDPPMLAAGLHRLALLGQVIHDIPAKLYRWRQVMPTPLTLDQIGVDDVETREGVRLLSVAKFLIGRDEMMASGSRGIEATVRDGRNAERKVELLLDADGRIQRGKCACSHHFKNALRMGPCRHLQSVRNHLLNSGKSVSMDQWFRSFWN